MILSSPPPPLTTSLPQNLWFHWKNPERSRELSALWEPHYVLLNIPTRKLTKYQYLDSGFRQVCAHGQPLSHHHIWVVSLLEGLLQRLQLLGGEGRATSPLFAVLGSITCLQNDVLKCTAVGRQEKWPI